MYADHITGSLERAIRETNRRREIQMAYNKKHNITPQTIIKAIRAKLVKKEEENTNLFFDLENKEILLPDEKEKLIKKLSIDMRSAAKDLDFEIIFPFKQQIYDF